MRIIKLSLFSIACIGIIGLLSLTSCTYTTSTSGSPDLSVDMTVFNKEIDSLIPNEGINLSTTVTNAMGTKTNSIELEIINGRNIPADATGVNTLGKNVALKLKHCLKNPAQFNRYKVVFNTKKSAGGLTENREISYECDNKDL